MQRGKYPVKDVEASYQKTAEAEYDNSFKMCIITIGVFLMICIILLLCTLPFTIQEPLQESQSQPQSDTDANTDDRPSINGAENSPHQPVHEEHSRTHTSNTDSGHRRKVSKTATQTTAYKVKTSTEISVLRIGNEHEHTAAENGKDSKLNAVHPEPPVVADTDDRSSEVEHGQESEEYEQENEKENNQLPPHPTVPQQEDTSTNNSEPSEIDEKKSEQHFDFSTPGISEQERTSTKMNETLEDDEKTSEQPPDVSTPSFKDNSSVSEQEKTSTKNNETSENEENKLEQPSDADILGSVPEQERTSTKKNETLENEEELEPEQTSDDSTSDIKDISSASEQETSSKKNETSENEERKPKQLSDDSTAEVKNNSILSEEEGIYSKRNETSENEETKPKHSSDSSINEVKRSSNETENIGENETARAEEDVAVTQMNEHYKETEQDFDYEAIAGWPLFHYQKNDSGSIIYGCYGFVEPLGKVRSTYYIYDSLGYHAVTPEEQFELILGPLKANNEVTAHDERNAQRHQRDKKIVKQWNYEYFLHKCGQPLPRHPEDTETTTRPSSTVGLERSTVQEKQLYSTESLPKPSKPSNDSENGGKPGEEQPPTYKETFGISARISTIPYIYILGPQQVTPKPQKSSNVSENGENPQDKLSSGHKEGSGVSQMSGVSTETGDIQEISQTMSQQFTPEPPKPSNVSRIGEITVDELASDHETGSTETSNASEKSHLKSQHITLEPRKSSNAPGDEQLLDHEGGSGVPANSGASEINHIPVTSESTKPSTVSGNKEDSGDKLPPDHDEPSDVSQKSGESAKLTSTPEISVLENQKVTAEPTKSYNVSGNERHPRHEEDFSVQHSSEASTEISNTTEKSYLDKQHVSAKPANSPTTQGNDENTGNKLLMDHYERTSVTQKSEESIEISNTPETSHLDRNQVTSEPVKSSNVSGNRENHGDEQPPGHEGSSNAPQKSRESVNTSSAPVTNLDSQQVTPKPFTFSNVLETEENRGDELPAEGSSALQNSINSDEIENTPDISHLGGQQVTPESPIASNISRNRENHGIEKNPGQEGGFELPTSSGESEVISNTPDTSNPQVQHITSEPPKRFNVSENEENSENDEGSDVTQEPGESTEINNTTETSHPDSQQITPKPPKPSNVSENWENLGNQLSSENKDESDVPKNSRGSAETSGTPETSYLKVTQELPRFSTISRNEEDLKNKTSSTDEGRSGVPKISEGSTETIATTETTYVKNQQNKTESEKPANEEEEEKEESAVDISEPEKLIASNNIDSQEGSYSNGWNEGLIA